MSSQFEAFLPQDLLDRGTKRGSEWAWPIADIPAVIDASRRANMVNVGGQLQFRIPNGGTCELYWIEVDALKLVLPTLPWQARVEQTAALALHQFQDLPREFDFLAEGQSAFGQYLVEKRASGTDPHNAMCFVWYFEAAPQD
jgi:hypothetical protein